MHSFRKFEEYRKKIEIKKKAPCSLVPILEEEIRELLLLQSNNHWLFE